MLLASMARHGDGVMSQSVEDKKARRVAAGF
jgi:hypothetical protein